MQDAEWRSRRQPRWAELMEQAATCISPSQIEHIDMCPYHLATWLSIIGNLSMIS
jgi:hypothetical protein